MRKKSLLYLALFATVSWLVYETKLFKHSEIRPDAKYFYTIPTSPYDGGPPGVGNIHGFKFKVPANYLKFPIAYIGESLWDKPAKPRNERTYSDGIQHISIEVHWPDMKPRLPENDANFRFEHKGFNQCYWFSFVASAGSLWTPPPENAPANVPRVPPTDNGNARLLRSFLNYRGDGFDADKAVHTEKRGLNTVLGLLEAATVGPGSEKPSLWNKIAYWSGDENSIVDTLITCRNGDYSDRKSKPSCKHRFYILELKIEATLYYNTCLLNEWRQLEEKTRELIFSFYIRQ